MPQIQEKRHFAIVCQSAKKPLYTLDEESFSEEESYDITDEKAYAISTAKQSNEYQVLVTCTVNKQHQVTFKVDTGASCNVLLLHDYVRSTGDKKGLRLKKTISRLTMHNNSCEYPLGRVMLPVTRIGTTHCLRFYTVNSCITPRNSCLGIKLIRILDSDVIYTVAEQ